MFNVGIRFNIRDLHRMMGSLRGIHSKVHRLKEDVPRRNSIEFKQLLVRNIMTQQHMGGFAPYNPKYAEWKAKYGRAGGGYWRLMGDLVKSLTSWKIDSTRRTARFFAGVPSYAFDRGGKSWFTTSGRKKFGPSKNIAWYGRIMEEGGTFVTRTGTQKHPPRPIIEPTTNEYEKNGFVRVGDGAMNDIRSRWRK